MATISSVTTTGRPGDTATIAGSGFGPVQGTTVLTFYPNSSGGFVTLTPTSWSATSITVDVPSSIEGALGFFMIVFDTSDQGVRSASFTVGEPLVAAATALDGQIVSFDYGTTGAPY